MRRIAIALSVVTLGACGDLEHKNPFDPSSPASAQARTSLAGTVSLEPVGGVVPRLEGIAVSVAGQSYSATTDASGAYVISGVPAGTYTIQAVLAGYETASVTGVTATLDTGQSTVTVPPLALRRVRADLKGTVQLKLPNDVLEATGGAQISLAVPAGAAAAGLAAPLAAGGGGTAGTALTDASGAFVIPALAAPLGSYTLTASKYGYATQTTTVTFQAGAFVVQTVQLVIDPGAIVGSVAVSGASDAFGVTVRARGSTVGGTPWEDVTTSDALGAFRLSGLPAGTYTVSYERADLVTSTTSARVVTPGADTTLEAVTLVPATGSIRGVVSLTGAASSAGAVVTASGPTSASTVTDAAGAFTLTGLAVGSYSVAARKDPDWQPATTTGLAVAREATTTVSTMSLAPRATARIDGTVALEGGGSAAGSTVTLSGTDFRGAGVNATATTGSGGGFSFPGLVAGSYQLVFSRAAYDTPPPVAASPSTGQTVALGTITLAASRGGASGTVLASGAASHAGTVVVVSGGPDTASAVTDAAGHWAVSGLRVGTGYVATYSRAAYAPASSAAFAIGSGATTAVGTATLALATSGSLSGGVAVERGSPAGVDVTLAGTDVNGAVVTASATTGATGAFLVSGLRAGTYSVSFARADLVTASTSGHAVTAGVETAIGSVTLALARGAVGGVAQLSGASSSAGVVVTASNATDSGSTVTDGAGAFAISGLPVGTYTVVARRDPDWQPVTTAAVAVARDTTTSVPASTLSPWATARIDGVVALEGGAATAGSTATLSGTDFLGAAVNRTATTGSGGGFSFPTLVAGSYQLVFSRTDYDTPPPVGVSLSTGQAVALGTITLAASRGGAAGTVLASGAASQAGTVVVVSGGPDTASAVTDASGHWAVSGLRVGSGYAATYSRSAYASSTSTPFTVASGAITAVASATLSLATTGSLSGAVAVERGTADGVTVSLAGTDVNGAAVSASTATAADGSWSIALLRQGTYSATFSKTGYDAASLAGLAVGAGPAAAPNVTLSVSLGTVAGNVSLSAGGITGFSVGTDFSGVVVTLEGADVPVAAAVTDASGAYRLEGVPVSLSGASYTVTARKTWFTQDQKTVLALSHATATVAAMTLPVAAGALTGVATLTNVPAGGDGLASANVGISITGTAFNGASFSAAALSDATGAWTSGALPPGSYDLLATATGRTCDGYARIAVGSGAPTFAGTVLCLDAVAPSGLVLGAPAVTPPQLAGFTPNAYLIVPITTQATDATSPSNLRGYQLAIGASPDWASSTLVLTTPTPPATLTFSGLTADARNVLWARPVDTAGNAGPAVSLEVVQDSQPPAAPSLSTSRTVVETTSTTITISGSEGDANFLGYQSATTTISPTASCPASTLATFATTPSSAAVTLTANMKTCFYARAVDRAGRLSTPSVLGVTADLTPPTSPTIAPLYDPSLLTVHSEYVDFFVTAPATDQPAGGGVAWRNVAWVEVDTGSGYQPLCSSAACRASGAYAPCSCGCTDARLVCDGATFKAIRVPLLDGTSNQVGIRAVDLAGNVGSGASQVVATATSLLPVAASSASETLPRGRGRLLGHRYTDSFLRLRDLGSDGRPDPSDATCNIGALGSWGGVVSRIGILGPKVVVHADGDLILSVRRAGPDGLFCAGGDDTEYNFYTAPGSVVVRNVTGSFAYGSLREYAAWLERNTTTSVDTVMVQAPNWLGTIGNFWFATLPPAVALYTPPAGVHVDDLVEGGDCLLSSLSGNTFRVDCKLSGLNSLVGATTYTLPAGARAAALSSDGLLLAWLESSGGAPALHVRGAGPDRVFGTADDTHVTRTATGSVPYGAQMAIDGSHVVVSETSVSGSTYWFIHWFAGPDGVFDDAPGSDDSVSRVLPSSVPRGSPSILANGLVAYHVYGLGVNLSDVLASDLSTFRWEAIEAAGFHGLATNGGGTLFFQRGYNLTARLPDGSEQQGGFSASDFAASGGNLVTLQGSSVYLRRRSGTTWFSGVTPVSVYSGSPFGVAAGGSWALVQTTEAGTRYRVANLSVTSPTTTLLGLVPGTTTGGGNGIGVSDTIVAYQCYSGTAGYVACVHHPGGDGVFGTGDDTTLLLNRPGTTTPYGVYGLAVSGDKIAFQDENRHMIVASHGPDGVFNTADDVHYDLGPAASGSAGTLTVAGDYAAWLQIPGTDGIQVIVANLAKATQRQVTTHYSMKELLAMDPSGRVVWVDYGFSAPTIFLYAP